MISSYYVAAKVMLFRVIINVTSLFTGSRLQPRQTPEMLPIPGAAQALLETNVELAGPADHRAVRYRDADIPR